MTREFTLDELDALIAEARKPLHIVDGQPAIVGETSRQFVTYDEDDGDTRIAVAAPDLAAFARRLLAEREAVARLHRQQVERLEDDAATVAAERDALRTTIAADHEILSRCAAAVGLWLVPHGESSGLSDDDPRRATLACRSDVADAVDALRATVDRLRPVVEALAAWIDDEALRDGSEESAYDAWDRAVDAVTLALGLPAKRWEETAPTLRALLADAPAEVPATERPRPALWWSSDDLVGVGFTFGAVSASDDAVAPWDWSAAGLSGTAQTRQKAIEQVSFRALAAGFDVPEVPDVG